MPRGPRRHHQWFWEAIESFNPEEQGQFLKFVTSCSRPPLLGFERLNPPICLQRVPNGEEGRLPSSATCMNLLKVICWLLLVACRRVVAGVGCYILVLGACLLLLLLLMPGVACLCLVLVVDVLVF